MVITKQALKTWLHVPDHIKKLTMQKITEIESFKDYPNDPFIVIGQVLTKEKHPNSDHLNLTTVDVGDEVLQIVCGASNVDVDQTVIVSKVGAILPGNFEIKAAIIRGVASNGMICSLKELGFSDKVITEPFKTGIYYFNEDLKPGSSALEALYLEGFSMELSITPNRGDLLSIRGYALDLAAMLNQKIQDPTFSIKYSKEDTSFNIKNETKGCLSYHARIFKNVVIKDSPWFIQQLLIQNDIRPVNNVVDITNYVLLMIGSPLHAFDLEQFETQDIVIRQSLEGEEVITLDDQKRMLFKSDIVITNGKDIAAIAGVMGNKKTSVSSHTKHILLEAAIFSRTSVSITSKRLNLKSDASLRFERGVSEDQVTLGLELATYLIQTLCMAEVMDIKESKRFEKEERVLVELSFDLVEAYLGIKLSKDEIVSYLLRYGYDVEVLETSVVAYPPSHRFDIHKPHDLIEEIGRMYGFDAIPAKPLSNHLKGGYTHKQKTFRALKHMFAHLSFQEVITYSLRPEKELEVFPTLGDAIRIMMPLSEDRKFLRQSLIPGMLEAMSYNVKRQQTSIHILELGRVFYGNEEKNHLTLMMHGPYMGSRLYDKTITPNFYMMKAMLKRIETLFHVKIRLEKSDAYAIYHPFQHVKAFIGDVCVGHLGALHPSLLSEYDLEHVYSLTLYLDEMYGLQTLKSYEPVSKFPTVSRDLSMILDKSMEVEKPLALIKQTLKAYIDSVVVFDLYEGSNIPLNKKSVACRIVLKDHTQTLESDEVDKLMKKVVNRLSFELQIDIRS